MKMAIGADNYLTSTDSLKQKKKENSLREVIAKIGLK